jgi:(S)-ureidoglycine aminohydrolase
MTHFSASQTRSHVAHNFAVLTPESHVPAAIAGWVNTQAVILIAPRSGAKFAEYIVALTVGGRPAAPPGNTSRFVYVLDGALTLSVSGQTHALLPGGYAYLPPDMPHVLGSETQARIAVVEKPYVATPHASAPSAVIVGREQDVATKPVGGDPDVFVKNLLPDQPGFDMAMNIMAFKPGAALSLIEVHVMEHGLLMIDGMLLYRLGDQYFPVQTGDAIYMAPFCPQWCAAFGKQNARYLLYKDWNRDAFGY